ncbi:MAG: tail fiber domain-containing protein [Methylophagaceae bacterium]|jgi:hypothetical protein|tara:strand:+ start:24 stop:683 length:660 start_codon:yes stop_codon:yes gene_type:complete
MAIVFRADKGSPLTYSQLDNNFGSYFYSASTNGQVLTMYYPSSSQVPVNSGSIDFSLIKGLQDAGVNKRLAVFSGSSAISSSQGIVLDVNDNLGIGVNEASDLPLAYKLVVSGSIKATGTVVQGSDERLKKDIAPIDNALSRINHIDGVFFKYKDSGDKSVGFVAQQIQKVLPEVVSEDNNGYLGVNYSGVTAVLVEAIREQSSIISDLESRLSKLENK